MMPDEAERLERLETQMDAVLEKLSQMISTPSYGRHAEFKILKNAKTTWARALEEIRCEKRISATELATSAGLTKVQYQGRLRNMKGPSPEDIDRLLQGLGSNWQAYLEKLGKLTGKES